MVIGATIDWLGWYFTSSTRMRYELSSSLYQVSMLQVSSFQMFVFTLFWYQFFCGFTAQNMIDPLYLLLHNLVFTSLPPLLMGVFDQDAPADLLFEQHDLYLQGPKALVCGFDYPYLGESGEERASDPGLGVEGRDTRPLRLEVSDWRLPGTAYIDRVCERELSLSAVQNSFLLAERLRCSMAKRRLLLCAAYGKSLATSHSFDTL